MDRGTVEKKKTPDSIMLQTYVTYHPLFPCLFPFFLAHPISLSSTTASNAMATDLLSGEGPRRTEVRLLLHLHLQLSILLLWEAGNRT